MTLKTNTPTFDEIIAEAERMWRVRYPNRNDSTYTALRQTAALFSAARRSLAAQ